MPVSLRPRVVPVPRPGHSPWGLGRPLSSRTMLARSPSPTRPAGFIEPCLPTPSRVVPDGPRRAFETKHDGFRFVALRDADRIRVFSRNGRD